METFSAIVTLYDRGESTGQWWIPLTKASDAEFFYVLFVLHLNKWLNKHSKRRWFQTPWRSSCDDVTVMRCPTPNRRQGINNHQIRIMCMLSLNLLYFIITRCNISRASIFLEISKDILNKQRFLTPGHQGWNDLHSLCRIGMEYYLLNNDDNNIIYWIMMIIMIMMMIIIMIIMMTMMMIIGTATIMIMIIIITTTLTMTIMKMIMIKTAHTPCQSLYKDRRI